MNWLALAQFVFGGDRNPPCLPHVCSLPGYVDCAVADTLRANGWTPPSTRTSRCAPADRQSEADHSLENVILCCANLVKAAQRLGMFSNHCATVVQPAVSASRHFASMPSTELRKTCREQATPLDSGSRRRHVHRFSGNQFYVPGN